MKLKTKIFGLMSVVSGMLLILTLFLPLFVSVEVDGTGKSFGMFNDFVGYDTRFKALNQTFQPAFANMTSVLCVISTILAGLFILIFLLQLLKVKAIPTRAILRAISFTLIMVGIISIVCAVAFIFMNKIYFLEKLLLSFKLGMGSYLLMVLTILTGVFGFIAESR